MNFTLVVEVTRLRYLKFFSGQFCLMFLQNLPSSGRFIPSFSPD